MDILAMSAAALLAQAGSGKPAPILVPVPPSPPPIRYAPPAPPPPPAPYSAPGSGRPRANGRERWFGTDDYPAAALRNEEEGTVLVRLTVDPNGRVSNCAILSSSASSALDAATCRIFRSRARFQPARDQRGQAVAGTHVDRVRWQLPDAGSIPFQPATARLRAAFAGHRMIECAPLEPPAAPTGTNAEDQAPLAAEGCDIVFPRREPLAALFDSGPPRIRITLEVRRNGLPPVPAIPETGRVLFAATASFRVLADGTLAECRARVALRPRRRGVPPIDLCALLGRSTLYLFDELEGEGAQPGSFTLIVREDGR